MDANPEDMTWVYAVMREQTENLPPLSGKPDHLTPSERYALRLRNAITMARSAELRQDAHHAETARMLGRHLLDHALMEGRVAVEDPRWDEDPLLFVQAEWSRASDEDRTPYPLRTPNG